ncbi:hypothetical protein J2S98_003832 [Arthrobacter oryzae]|uniref:hypothetical protein n=1 Tax=Arthrobacter oryzae TaxID=409290 RepID=UPI00277DA117|nr:hypothetical protein [Arthrobacter oryzae]MDP9988644.1 hypothetical protein [Arthrobacter oryzae]
MITTPPEPQSNRRAFWKGSIVTAAISLLLSTAVTVVILAGRPVPASSASPAPAVTVGVPGPTQTVTVAGPERTVAVQGPTTTATATATVTVTATVASPELVAALNQCRDAVEAGDKALNNYIRNIRLTSGATLESNRLGNPGPMDAATAQLQATASSDRAQYELFASARNACRAG